MSKRGNLRRKASEREVYITALEGCVVRLVAEWDGTFVSTEGGDPGRVIDELRKMIETKEVEAREIPASNGISLYFHCAKCLAELPEGVSPKEWARTQAGWTKQGLQVWCSRHDMNVIHIDFDGVKHRANVSGYDISDSEEA